MTTTPPPGLGATVDPTRAVVRGHLLGRLLRNPLGMVAVTFLLLIVAAALLAPVLAPLDPDRADVQSILTGPSADHVLGTDGSGRDILSRLLFASRLSLAAAFVVVLVAAVLGVTGGLLAGYYGRWFAAVGRGLTSVLLALPGLVVLLAARTVLGPSLWSTMVVFGVLIAPAFYMLTASSVAAVRDELYVDAARVFGLSDVRILGRHVMVVVRGPVIVLGSTVFGIAISLQAGLDFLGLGDPSKPTWGAMLSSAFESLYSSPIQVLWPSLAIGLTCMALVLLGVALRDELERVDRPTSRRRQPSRGEAAALAAEVSLVVHDVDAHEAEDAVLAVRGLAVGYPRPDGSTKRVVEDVSLTVRRGEVHGLVGESGSGKTQTAFAVLRLLPPGGSIVAGSVLFQGEDLAQLSNREMVRLRGNKIAYVPQEPMSNLDPAFTIGHQLVEPMRAVLGISRREARTRALALLEKVGISEPARTFSAYPHQVSGGMAQRVLIAGAVSCNPDLLIADEPTTALDVTVQAEVLDLLRDLREEFDMGVLLVTHNFGVVADICDRVSVMQEGRIVESGPTRALFAAPQHPYTQSLFAAVLAEATPRSSVDGQVVTESGTEPVMR